MQAVLDFLATMLLLKRSSPAFQKPNTFFLIILVCIDRFTAQVTELLIKLVSITKLWYCSTVVSVKHQKLLVAHGSSAQLS